MVENSLSKIQQHLASLDEKAREAIQQIPLTYLASYLGISLETLSRIRARI